MMHFGLSGGPGEVQFQDFGDPAADAGSFAVGHGQDGCAAVQDPSLPVGQIQRHTAGPVRARL